MSTERQAPSLYPCGKTRREFVWQMGGGFAGLALSSLLSADEFFAPKKPHFARPAKACIFLMMNGGPSQVDTFDYKPALLKYAGKKLPPDKKYINSGGRRVGYLTPHFRPFRRGGESGLQISDYFPKVRKHADKLAVINSCHTDSHAHGSALVAMNSGSTFIGRPTLGTWVTYGLGTENSNLPSYVVILDKRGGPISGQPNWSSGFMPAAYQGTLFRPTGDPIVDLRGPKHIDTKSQREQIDFLQKLNQKHLDARPGGDELAARIQSYELAYRMQSEAPEAVDLSSETRRTKELYGLDKKHSEEFGRNCLIARRLVERGVRFVQLYSGGGHLEETWDAHAGIESNHGQHAPEVDQPIAGLLTDLQERGLLDSTLIVWGGEFGRMPFSEGVNLPGRNHNPYGFSMWLAGGGVKGGVTYGETDEFGFEAKVDKVHLHDLHATILHLMGLDHEALHYFHQGRKETLTDVHGRVVTEIVA